MVEERLILGLPNLNWRRCLQRLWLTLTLVLWGVLAASQLPALLTPPKVVIEAEQVQKLRKLLEQSRQGTLPDTVREELRVRLEKGELTNGVRYNVTIVAAGVEERRSYPAEQTEAQVRDAANLIAQQTQQQAWVRLASLALLLPLAMMLVTKLLAWCFAGLSVPVVPPVVSFNTRQEGGHTAAAHTASQAQLAAQNSPDQDAGVLFASGDRSHPLPDAKLRDDDDRVEPRFGQTSRPPLDMGGGTTPLKI
jgi:hypothetical protein